MRANAPWTSDSLDGCGLENTAAYEYVIRNADSKSRVASLPKGPAIAAMKLAYHLRLSPLGPYHYKMIAEDFTFDTSRIKSRLGWKPTVSNEQMLWRAYEYYSRNRKEIESRRDVSAPSQHGQNGRDPSVEMGVLGRMAMPRGSSVAILLVLLLTACHRKFPEPASFIAMGDKSVSNQLTSGFYNAEGSGWRWTAKRFSVLLRPPPEARSRVTKLSLNLFVPQMQIEKLGPLTLKAEVGNCALAAQTFAASGSYSYTREVPKSEAVTNVLPVRFSFDHANTHVPGDPRELAVIVKSVGVWAD